jgi:NAD-dependent SIR2 family protein deacetylase
MVGQIKYVRCRKCGSTKMKVDVSAYNENDLCYCPGCGSPRFGFECADCGSTDVDEYPDEEDDD